MLPFFYDENFINAFAVVKMKLMKNCLLISVYHAVN